MAAAAAPLAIKAGSQIVGAVVGLLLGAHTARLKGATNENAALDAVISPFDADLQQIADAFNSGQASADTCIAALIRVDSQIYQYLRAKVGPAGTAWSAPSTDQIGTGLNPSYSADCGKACTAGCCVYSNDLRPAIFGRNLGGGKSALGLIQAIQQGQGTVTVPEVYPPSNTAYGNYSRPLYQIAIQAPPFGVSVAGTALSSITSTVDSLFGNTAQPAQNGTSPYASPAPSPLSILGLGNGSSYGGGSVMPAGSPAPMQSNLSGFALIGALFIAAVLIVARLMK